MTFDKFIFVSVDRGVRFGVSLITLVFVSCGACFFFFFNLFIVFSQQAYSYANCIFSALELFHSVISVLFDSYY